VEKALVYNMDKFQIKSPGAIIFKAGSASDPEVFKSLNVSGRVLLVTDSTLVSIGVAEKVKKGIMETGSEVIVYDDIESQPNASSVQDLVDFAREEEVDTIVGLGGGSPMDMAKIAALLIQSPQSIESTFDMGNAKGERLPLLLIPTTAGTGSEATSIAIVTNDDGEKRPVVSQQLLCDSVILDAELTIGLPPAVTAATGVDAIVHAIEGFTSEVRKNPVAHRLALQSLDMLYNNLRVVVDHGEDIEARGKMLLGSFMAGLVYANTSAGTVHALAYSLGKQFHLSHGESNAIVLVPVMRFNLTKAVKLYAQLSRSVYKKVDAEDDMQAAMRLINELDNLLPAIGLKSRLSQYGISENDLDNLTDVALRQSELLSDNISPMKREDIFSVFRSVLN
jgi:alcohol dehydrogenase class IV